MRVAGQTYRVVASAEAEVLHRLAAAVDARVNELTLPGRQVSAQSVLLAAISLAHELEEERAKYARLEARAQEMFGTLLERVERALEDTDSLVAEPSHAAGALRHSDPPDEHPDDI